MYSNLANASSEPLWYAVTVKPRHEKTVAQHLRLRSIEEFLPLYQARHRWSDRSQLVDLPLFTGYVFCRFGKAERLRVLNTPSITSIVGFAGNDAPVPESEIAAVRDLLVSGLPVEPWPYLRIGERVRIESGAMAGVEGILIREKSRLRVVVSVDLLQRSVAAEIDRDMLSAVRGGPSLRIPQSLRPGFTPEKSHAAR